MISFWYLVAVAVALTIMAEPMRPKDISRLQAWSFLIGVFVASVALAAAL